MEGFRKMLMKKAREGKFLKDDEVSAKMDVLKELKDMARDGMASDLKKVTVASDSKEGLKKGLEKAKEVLDSKEVEEEMEDEDESEDESKSDKIKKLEAELAALKGDEE